MTRFYTAPTAIRSLMRSGDGWANKYDKSSLRVLGTVGEPINPEAWRWYHEVIGGGKVIRAKAKQHHTAPMCPGAHVSLITKTQAPVRLGLLCWLRSLAAAWRWLLLASLPAETLCMQRSAASQAAPLLTALCWLLLCAPVQVPVVDTWWQTETGGHMITNLPGAWPEKPGSATLPFFGVAPAVLDEKGNELQGACEGCVDMCARPPGLERAVSQIQPTPLNLA